MFSHYHNIRLSAPPERPSGVSDGKPAKQATNHPKPARNAQALFLRLAWSMLHKCIARKFTPFSGVSPLSAFLPIENGGRGRNLFCGRRSVITHTGNSSFQHVQESGFVDGQQSRRYGRFAGRLHHTILTGDSTRDPTRSHHGHKNAKSDDSTLRVKSSLSY